MVVMLCEGCGGELLARSRFGRTPRFHGPTCRQRAHRARLATGQAELLGALDSLARDVGAARHAVLSGVAVPDDVRERIGAAAATVAGLPVGAVPVENVTEIVTDTGESHATEEPGDATPVGSVTEIVTDSELPQAPAPKSTAEQPVTKRRGAPRRAIDPATVRLGSGSGGVYDVLAGAADNPTTLGTVQPVYGVTGKPKHWTAAINGHRLADTFTSRKHAVSGLVVALNAQQARAAERQRRARRTSSH